MASPSGAFRLEICRLISETHERWNFCFSKVYHSFRLSVSFPNPNSVRLCAFLVDGHGRTDAPAPSNQLLKHLQQPQRRSLLRKREVFQFCADISRMIVLLVKKKPSLETFLSRPALVRGNRNSSANVRNWVVRLPHSAKVVHESLVACAESA